MRAQTSRFFVAGLMAALAVCGAADAADQVAWASDLPNAQKLAGQRNQLVLLHFWSPDCAPCQRLEFTVFKDSEFGRVVSRDFVPVKINVKESPALAYQYGVNRWPMDVITTPDGRLIHKMVSPHESRQYSSILGQISARRQVYGDDPMADSSPTEAGLAAYNQLASIGSGPSQSMDRRPASGQPASDQAAPNPSAYGQSAYNPSASSQLGYDRDRTTSGYASYPTQPPRSVDLPYETRRDASYGGLSPQQPTESRQTPLSGEVHNPYTSHRPSSPPTPQRDLGARPEYGRAATPEPWNRSQQGPTASGALANDYASRQLQVSARYGNVGQNLTTPPNRRQPNDRASAGPARDAYSAAPPPVRQTPPRPALAADPRSGPEPGPAVGRDSVPPSASYGSQTPRRPAGPGPAGAPPPNTPAWGLEGYCPVALVEQSKWVKGDPRWGIAHRGRTYLFSSVDAKQRFWSQPDRYAPALSGVDPVLFTSSGQHVDGKRNHGVVYRDQIYLFANEETLQRFWRSPEDYAEQVRQATRASEDRQRRR